MVMVFTYVFHISKKQKKRNLHKTDNIRTNEWMKNIQINLFIYALSLF